MTREERNAYKRAQRAKLRGQPLPPWVAHGSSNAISNYGCKCPTCKTVENDYARERMRAKRKAAS